MYLHKFFQNDVFHLVLLLLIHYMYLQLGTTKPGKFLITCETFPSNQQEFSFQILAYI
jgi:hypothetical protein